MTNTRKTMLLAGMAIVMGSAAWATDYTAMRNDTRVHNELLGVSVAKVIDENCPSIDFRQLKVFSRAMSLKSYAKGLGYSSSEISAYVDSKTEQARFRVLANTELAKHGAVVGNTESMCRIGHAEIEMGSYVGAFLR